MAGVPVMPRPGLPPLPDDVWADDPNDDENRGVDPDWRHDVCDKDW